MHLRLKPVLYFLVLLGLFSTAFAWDPAPSYRQCADVARRAAVFPSPSQFQSWLGTYRLMSVASGRVQVHTRLRVCGELGYAAGQSLIKLDYREMGKLYEEAKRRMPDYHLGMSYTYANSGPQTPALALNWASGARVNTAARYYAGREQRSDPVGQTVYDVADAASFAYLGLGLPVSDVLSFVFGSAEWENETYTYRFDLSSPANVKRLAGEPVSLLVRNSHGSLGNRSFSFASFK